MFSQLVRKMGQGDSRLFGANISEFTQGHIPTHAAMTQGKKGKVGQAEIIGACVQYVLCRWEIKFSSNFHGRKEFRPCSVCCGSGMQEW